MTTLPDQNPTSNPITFLYILDENNKVVEESDLNRWIKWTTTHSRTINRTYIDDQSQTEVSTVFLGVSLDNPPALFETMIFGSHAEQDLEFQRRYATYEEAMSGHNEVVETIKLRREVQSGRKG